MTKLMIIGDYWSREEVEKAQSFSGGMRPLLNYFLQSAQIDAEDIYFTDVFQAYPESSRIQNFCGTKAEGIPGLPLLSMGKYILAEHAHHLERLDREINAVRPNLILALGGAAVLAVTGQKSAISTTRGSMILTRHTHADGTPIKMLATHHPREVIREWKLRPIVLMDYDKAKGEMESPVYERPIRYIWTAPDITDMTDYMMQYLAPDWSIPTGVDIETKRGTITEIGFSPSIGHAIVVPFYSRAEKDGNYWRTQIAELAAWKWVAYCLHNLTCPIFQNGLYDINYLWTTMGLTTPGASEDTMLMAHALQPELRKGLGFLGSIYSDEPFWKNMRKEETLKKEDN
jgi:uracil-DNA glycosylase